MNKSEIAEIKKRLKKESCTFTRIAGFYRLGENEHFFSENFLGQEDTAFYKYLEIAKKVLSGKEGDNIVNLEFSEVDFGIKNLLPVVKSEGKDMGILKSYFRHVAESYGYPENYVILCFFDSYDVPQKGGDGFKTGDSDEVFTYMLSCVCPIELIQPSLGFFDGEEDDKAIGAVRRPWIVKPPVAGFMYPAFNERSTDTEHVLFYQKNAKEPDIGFMENVLKCGSKQTISQKKARVTEIIEDNIVGDAGSDVSLMLQKELSDTVAQDKEISRDDIKDALRTQGVEEKTAETIVEKIEKEIEEPAANIMVDEKILKKKEDRIELLEMKNRKKKEDIFIILNDLNEKYPDEGWEKVIDMAKNKAPYA